MAKRGKGKLRTALANHTARSQQRAYEKKRELERGSKAKSAPSSTVPKRTVQPFLRDDTILLVGEGNFSFTLALLSAPYHHPPHRILATSYDSEEEVYKKYPDARDIIHQIKQMSGAHASRILAFNVDAGALHKCDAVTGTNKSDQRRWSKVWFGFPHVGAGHKNEHRNVLANQLLILRFLISVAPYLTEGPLPEAIQGRKRRAASEDDEDDEEPIEAADDEPDVSATSVPPRRQGSVLITIRNVVPYTLWNIPMLGKRLRDVLQPIAASAPSPPKGIRAPTVSDVDKNGAQYVLWRSFEFVPSDWPGYSHRRTVGFVEGLSTSHNEDLLRRPTQPPQQGQPSGRHVGTGECRTYELALRPVH